MRIRTLLLAAAATGVVAASGASAAAPKKRHSGVSNQQLLDEVNELKAEVAELRAQNGNQAAAQSATQAQVDATRQQVEAVAANSAQQQQQIAAMPGAIKTQVAQAADAATEKAHHADKFYFKGLTITPGGFLEMAGIYRSAFQGNDLASSFAIPFPNNRAAHTSEGRFSARQSRLSFLAEGQVSKDVKLSMYGEFDFLGGAQTANSNESNSYNPRIRNVYGTIDWNQGDHGWHLLAGQNWSLVTLNSKGITPRNEQMPPQIDAQYIPGFTWARQPQIRLTGDFLDHKLWIAVSAENPATTFGGSVPANVTATVGAGSGFDSANSLSLNSTPDFVGKIAYEANLGGHSLHIEGLGLERSFKAHLNGAGNVDAHGYGVGGGAILQVVPGLLDVQFSGLTGKGIGRYGSTQLPDVTFDANGDIHPVHEYMMLAGATVHATRKLDLYGFAGEEQQRRAVYGTFGVGLPTANNSGCFIEGGTCAGNSRRIRQLTFGFWDKIYAGSFGRAQVGIQYSYTQRQLFPGLDDDEPQAHQNMGFLSFRYYPF